MRRTSCMIRAPMSVRHFRFNFQSARLRVSGGVTRPTGLSRPLASGQPNGRVHTATLVAEVSIYRRQYGLKAGWVSRCNPSNLRGRYVVHHLDCYGSLPYCRATLYTVRVGTIALGDGKRATNVGWGGDDWKTLFVTTFHELASIRMKIPGVAVPRRI